MIWCATHEERGFLIPATRDVAGTPMCEECFRGEPVLPGEMMGECRRIVEMEVYAELD